MALRPAVSVLTTANQVLLAAVAGRAPNLRVIRWTNNDTVAHSFVLSDGTNAIYTWIVPSGQTFSEIFREDNEEFGWVFTAGNAVAAKVGEALITAGTCLALVEAGRI